MKKTIVLSLALLFATIFNYSSAKPNGEPLPAVGPSQASTLIIDAHVTVVLVNNDKAAIQVVGEGSLTKLIAFKNTGDTLVISSTRNKDLKGAGIIYVPASKLKNIRINRAAHVRSLFALHVPKLDVVINGDCQIAISNIGEVNVSATEFYSFEGSKEVRQVPLTVLLK